jgi:hypothetical protein
LFCQSCANGGSCAPGLTCRNVNRDEPQARCLSQCRSGDDCIAGTTCNRGYCVPVNAAGGWSRPRQAAVCAALLHLGDPCESSAQCDRASGDYQFGHCASIGPGAGRCAKVCRLNYNPNPPECPMGWSCNSVQAWNSRWIGQCQPD